VLNPALAEMVATDRIRELERAAAQRSLCSLRFSVPTETAAPRASSGSIRHAHLGSSRRAIGWFLVSVGLHLALPRTRTGSV
jgi:hypothetical protein